MEGYMTAVILLGGCILVVLILGVVGILTVKKKAKNKSVKSLPKGADQSEYTQEFIRRYETED